MEISLQQQTAAPPVHRVDQTGAASSLPSAEIIQTGPSIVAPTPTQMGIVGVVNEALIGTLSPSEPINDGVDRTLKPYDTVMLPHSISDEKRIKDTG